MLSYGLTIASKGQEDLLKELDKVLQECSAFSVQKVSEKAKKEGEALDASLELTISPADLETEEKKEMMEEKCAAYWTTLAPNVEDYSGTAAKLIAAGSGQLVKGILWCGDVTVERLRWGNEKKKKRKTTTLLTWQLAQGASSRTERQREAKRHRFPVSLLVPPIFLACSWLLPFQPNPLYYFYLFSFPNQYTP